MDQTSSLTNVKNQVYGTLIASLIIFSHGANMGWLSPSLPLLLSNDTPLVTGPLSNEQLSNVGSINSIGAVVATFMCGSISIVYGSKIAMISMGVPALIFWLLIIFGDTYTTLLMGRFLVGITGGSFQSGIVTFVSEIADNDYRGRLGSVNPLARNMGILMSFIAGAFIEYEYRPFIFILISIVYFCLVPFLPSTPSHLLKKGEFKKAEEALRYYKGCDKNNKSDELALKMEFERIKAIEEERKNSPKIQMKDFFNRSTLKGIVSATAMAYFPQTTGCFIINNYASLFFAKSGSTLSVEISTIILAITQIFGGLVSTQLGDKFGRKTTNFVSLAGATLGLFIFAGYSYMRHCGNDVSNFMWLPVLCLSFIIFISSVGITALANTCALENFPPNTRPAGLIYYSLMINLFAFFWGKSFPLLLELIHLHGVLFLLAGNCCLGLLFIAFVVKETKGAAIDTMNSTSKQTNTNNDTNKTENEF